MFIQLYSFNIMCAYCVPGTLLDLRDMSVNKIKTKGLPSWSIYPIRRQTINTTKQIYSILENTNCSWKKKTRIG